MSETLINSIMALVAAVLAFVGALLGSKSSVSSPEYVSFPDSLQVVTLASTERSCVDSCEGLAKARTPVRMPVASCDSATLTMQLFASGSQSDSTAVELRM